MLADQGFQGRTVDNWAYVMAGIQCVPSILPELNHWTEEFEGFKTEIYEAIRKEEALQKEHNPLHEFFGTIEYYATQKIDSASDYHRRHNVLDHRHFRCKVFKEFVKPDGKVYQGEVIYVHLNRIWLALQDNKAEITKQTTLEFVTRKLENSSYFLSSSEQIKLTSSIDAINKENNLRCIVLNVKQLKENDLLTQLVEQAQLYENKRLVRLNS